MNNNHNKPIGQAPAPGEVAIGEKANDFIGSIKKLMLYCNKFIPVIIVSVILAVVSSVFSPLLSDTLLCK